MGRKGIPLMAWQDKYLKRVRPCEREGCRGSVLAGADGPLCTQCGRGPRVAAAAQKAG